MVSTIAAMPTASLGALARRIAGEIVRPRLEGDSLIVQTGVLMPTGRVVTVRISGGPHRFVVSDDGCAMRELALADRDDPGAQRAIKTVAEADALKFDGHTVYDDEVAPDQIVGFVSIIASAAARGVESARNRQSRPSTLDRVDQRLRVLYGPGAVIRDVHIIGSSTRPWKFDFEIARPDKRSALLHVVANHPNAIAQAYTRFDDVARLDDAPRLGAILDGDFGPSDLALLRRAAGRVIRIDDPDENYLSAA